MVAIRPCSSRPPCDRVSYLVSSHLSAGTSNVVQRFLWPISHSHISRRLHVVPYARHWLAYLVCLGHPCAQTKIKFEGSPVFKVSSRWPCEFHSADSNGASAWHFWALGRGGTCHRSQIQRWPPGGRSLWLPSP